MEEFFIALVPQFGGLEAGEVFQAEIDRILFLMIPKVLIEAFQGIGEIAEGFVEIISVLVVRDAEDILRLLRGGDAGRDRPARRLRCNLALGLPGPLQATLSESPFPA